MMMAIDQQSGLETNNEHVTDSLCGVSSEKQAGRNKSNCFPKWQPFRLTMLFAVVAGVAGLLVTMLRLYISTQISTIEKQFGYNSAKSGSVKAAYNIGYLAFVIPVSHLGSTSHRPRILGVICLLIGLAGILAALPHFILKPSQFNPSSLKKSRNPILNPDMLCRDGTTSANLTVVKNCDTEDRNVQISASGVAYGFLATSYLLQGMANGPRSALQMSYVDDNIEHHSTGYFIGVIMFLTILGGVASFSLGGLFNRLYVHLYDPGFGPEDPRWIGAWWLGFLVFGIMAVLWSVSFFLFPKHINKREVERTEAPPMTKKRTLRQMKDVLPSLGRLTKNPVYCLNVLVQTFISFTLWGKIVFMAKYIEIQFRIPVWKSNIIVAMASVAVADIGAITGGVLLSRLRLNTLSVLKMMVISLAMSAVASAGTVALACSGRLESDVLKQNGPLCGSNCSCAAHEVFPVCGSDGSEYLSPCLAGCVESANKTFQHCSCIGTTGNGIAVPGFCTQAKCFSMIPFLVLLSVSVFFKTVSSTCGTLLAVRCVDKEDKAIALGFMAFVKRLIGELPSGTVFGIVIDSSCSVWNRTCDGTGACALYDNQSLRFGYLGLWAGIKFLGTMAGVVGYIIERKRHGEIF